MSAISLSLVIPTYNERPNIVPLVAELVVALGGSSWEVVFVDDSTDGTDARIAELGRSDARIRLIHRDENRGGLAGAVVEGIAVARGTYVGVLDADLQHPPDRVPLLLDEAVRSDVDVVVASRYISGGSAGGLEGPLRVFYSRGLRFLSRSIFPRRLATISDPLGGYFIVRRSVLDGVSLRPIGYKILLEILVRCKWTSAGEVPYCFDTRRYGTSKATFRQGVQFLRHIATLAWDCSPAFLLPRWLVRHPGNVSPSSDQAVLGSV